MATKDYITATFNDCLSYKPSDIKTLLESEMGETLRFIKMKTIIEKMELSTFEAINEAIDNLNLYKEKIEKSNLPEEAKKSLLTEISNLVLGVIKFISPYIVKLLGWLVGLVVNTKTFGKVANSVSDAVKKVTPESIKNALAYAKEKYQNADTAFQELAQKINAKVSEVFKGKGEKPPLINADAIAKAHSNLVSKIEKWPLVGKMVSLGKKFGISPKGFYTFLSITILSIFAMTGSFGAAVVLVLYGANVAAQRLVSAGKETGQKIADKAEQGMQKAKGEESPSNNTEKQKDYFDDLDSLLTQDESTTSTTQELSSELDQISSKWSEKLKAYIDKGDKEAGINKIKEALKQLEASNDIKKEEISPFIKNMIKKLNANGDLEKALMGAFSDLAIS